MSQNSLKIYSLIGVSLATVGIVDLATVSKFSSDPVTTDPLGQAITIDFGFFSGLTIMFWVLFLFTFLTCRRDVPTLMEF